MRGRASLSHAMTEERSNRHHHQFNTHWRGRRKKRWPPTLAEAGLRSLAGSCGDTSGNITSRASALAGLGPAGAFRLSPPPMRQARNRDEETEARTMQLFPKEQAKMKPAETLTILFEGRVLVFEDFPADKAKELIEMLEWASSPVPAVPQKPEVAGLSNLPMARKASLQHFLEKRKHRIRAAYNPYKNDKIERRCRQQSCGS